MPALREVQKETVPWPSGRSTDTGPPAGPGTWGRTLRLLLRVTVLLPSSELPSRRWDSDAAYHQGHLVRDWSLSHAI